MDESYIPSPDPRELSYSPRSPDGPPPPNLTEGDAYNPYAGDKFTFGDDELAKYKPEKQGAPPATTEDTFFIGSEVLYKDGNKYSVRMVEGDNIYLMNDEGADFKANKGDAILVKPEVREESNSDSSMDYGPNGPGIKYDSDGSIDYGPPRSPEGSKTPVEEPEGDSAPVVSEEDEGF